jgi:uncharacterized protein
MACINVLVTILGLIISSLCQPLSYGLLTKRGWNNNWLYGNSRIEQRPVYDPVRSPNSMPSLNDIQLQLQAIKPVLQETYQVAQVGIFGSYVRGEQTANSDLDILVEFLPDARFGLTKFCELEDYLSDALSLKVDLVMKTGLKPHIGDRILQEVIYL